MERNYVSKNFSIVEKPKGNWMIVHTQSSFLLEFPLMHDFSHLRTRNKACRIAYFFDHNVTCMFANGDLTVEFANAFCKVVDDSTIVSRGTKRG